MLALTLLSLLSSYSARAEPAAEPITVTYEIPAPGKFKPYAQTPIPYAITRGPGSSTAVRYTLPATLLGQDRTFELHGAELSGGYGLHGKDADMSCNEESGVTSCKVTHHEVTIDLAAVKAALEASDYSSEQRAGRLSLAKYLAHALSLARAHHKTKERRLPSSARSGDLVGVFTYSEAR